MSGKRKTKSKEDGESAGFPVEKEQSSKFPVVCIGSSAGGLDALQRFFKCVPKASGMAYILISHLDPTHVSMLPELIQACSKIPVHQVEDGVVIEPNRAYIIPPNKSMTILGGALHLLEQPKQPGPRLAIDTFLRSLALDQKDNAVCIILSGAGSDGALGLREIRRESGMVMVQDPETAQFSSMPDNAIRTKLVDYVLPPEEMPEQLIQYERQGALNRPQITTINKDVLKNLGKICGIIRKHTGHDFSGYKEKTICRRIERRLLVHQLDRAEDYVRYLSGDQNEITVLFQELLIGVTNFFRDTENFASLKDNALLKIIKKKPERSALRVWIPGCSTGEEAYSVAILLQECMEQFDTQFVVQIFATDIDDEAIKSARQGSFPSTIAADVSEERLRRFFIMENGEYLVKKDIRAMVTFATHNVLKDPPFSNLDLICCRNLMIYLGAASQQTLMSVFHYSLKPGGFLFLGGSESIGGATNLFKPIDQKHKVFQHLHAKPGQQPILTMPVGNTLPQGDIQTIEDQEISVEPIVFRRVERCLLEKYAPPSMVVDSKGEIIYVIHGDGGKYLDLVHGKAQLNILQMAKKGIRSKLTTTLHKVVSSNQCIALDGLRIKYEGRETVFNIIVEPMIGPDIPRGFFLIVFEDADAAAASIEPVLEKSVDQTVDDHTRQLEDELRTAREDLQATMEVMESSHEELKSTNEELQSTNEELQSSNEELVTSKEEMQSLNEELSTVNAENEARITAMVKAYDDIRNLLNCTPFATIFVDCQLRIRRYTPLVTQIMNFIETDVDRPLADITTRLKYDSMVADVRGVLNSLAVCEKEVTSVDDQTFIMRITPYRTLSNVIDGAVIAFIDITERKRLSILNRLYTAVLQSSTNAIMLLDPEGYIILQNKVAEELYGLSSKGDKVINACTIIKSEDQKRFLAVLAKVYEGGEPEILDIVRGATPETMIPLRVTINRVMDDNGDTIGLSCSEAVLGDMG